MKKSLIALAVAGAMTAPMIAQADATLYGIAEVRVLDVDNADMDVNMNKTRLGVKGSNDLANLDGVEGFFQFEWEFNGNGAATASTNSANVAVRKSLVGLKGGFGTVILGRQNNPAAETNKTDIFKNGSAYASVDGDRLGHVAAYATPNMGGFQATLAVVVDGSGADASGDQDADATVLQAKYEAAGLSVVGALTSVSEEHLGATDDLDITSIGASYTMDMLTVGGSWANTDSAASDLDAYGVAATYKMGNAVLKAGVDVVELNANDDGSKSTVHAGYSLGAGAYAYVQYDAFNNDAETLDGKADTLSAGYSLSF